MNFKPAAVVAVVLLLLAATYSALALNSVLSELRSINIPREHELRIDPIQLMGTITKSKVVDGTTITATYVQQVDEDYGDFVRRANEEWKILCESLE